MRAVLLAIGAVVVALVAPTRPAAQSGPDGYVAPRLADGRPDLQGVWENNSATPLERPPQLADTPLLSDAQLEAAEAAGRDRVRASRRRRLR